MTDMKMKSYKQLEAESVQSKQIWVIHHRSYLFMKSRLFQVDFL